MTVSTRVRPDLLEEGDFPVPFGRYTLLGLLGEGGMARVFQAELQGARGFRKKSAVKVIRAAIGEQDARLTRALIHEARLGGLLHHPNVVETYDFGEENDQAWIAMELVTGACLSQLLREDEPLPPPVALEVAAQICAGLDHAHTIDMDGTPAPMVHRDLKPSNVMVANSGLVKVLDFGIAKATHIGGNTTETGLTKGTPAYMSPEQAAGKDVDARSDLFAVGCLLYEMLTGSRFFSGDTVYAIMMNVVRVEDLLKEIDRLDAVEAAAPGASVVIRRCMRADRDHRYASAKELERAIRALQGPVQAPGPVKNWVDACRAAMDPRFEERKLPTSRPRVGPAQIAGGRTEELSLDAEPAAAASLSGAAQAAPHQAEVLPRTRTFAPQATPPPPPAAKPSNATLAPTRMVPPTEPKLSKMALAGAAVGVLLGVLGVALYMLFLRDQAPVPQPTPVAVATPAPLAESTPEPVASTPTAPVRATSTPSSPSTTPAPAANPAPVAEAAPTPRATPRPTPRSTPKPAVPAATLSHRAPKNVVIGAPTHLSVTLDPPGACTPKLAYAPWGGGDWAVQRMDDGGNGVWEAELFLPYDVAWRSGVRYQFRCERNGQRVASWPDSGAKKVPSLAR